MKKGTYIRTDVIRQKNRLAQTGKRASDNTKNKMHMTWCIKYNNGYIHPCIGKISPKKGKSLIQQLGKNKAEQIINTIKRKLKGRKQSFESNIKRSLSLKGMKKPEGFGAIVRERLKGVPKTLEHRKNISLNHVDYHLQNNPNWKGGKSFEEYSEEFQKIKFLIRERDNHECQICNKHQISLRDKLNIHHIDYDKNNNDKINLISLCRNCHVKTNGNRNYWKWQLQVFMNLFHNADNKIDWGWKNSN